MRQDGRRHEAWERQRQLIDATIAALAKHGSGRISVRLIAAEAHVSAGLITHHFGSIDMLVAAACEQLSQINFEVRQRIIEDAGTEPRTRLMGIVAACFRPPMLSPISVAAWLAITGLAPSMPAVAKAQQRALDRLREQIERLMTACAPDRSHRLPTSALIGLIQGLWIQMAAESPHVTAEEGERLVLHWLGALGLFRDDRSLPVMAAAAHSGFAWEPQRQMR